MKNQIDESVVRTWGDNTEQRVWLDDAATLINAETGLRVAARHVNYVHFGVMGPEITDRTWTTVVTVPDGIQILTTEQQKAIASGLKTMFDNAVAHVIQEIKTHPHLYFQNTL